MPVHSTTCSSGVEGRAATRRPPAPPRAKPDVLPPLTVFEPGSGSPDGAVCALRPTSVSSRQAREFTTTTLRSWGLAELVEDAVVIVSELVTNAVRHGVPPYAATAGEAPIKLSLVHQGRFVVLIVSDPSTRGPQLRPADYVCENGRGLHVIEALSRAWGWTPVPGEGKAVWAALSAH